MSVFNRVVVAIVSLAILAGAIITLLVATGVSAPDILQHGWFELQLQRVADATGGSKAGIIAISVVVALGMIGVLFLEFEPLRKPAPILISSTEQGITTIDVDSVCMLAESAAVNIHNVHDARCRLWRSEGGLIISCRVSVILGSNIPKVGAELQDKIKEAIEQLIEMGVAQVDVKIKYKQVETRRLAVR